MRKLIVSLIMCMLFAVMATAQQKPQQRAEVKKPTKVETLAVRPSSKWKKSIATAAKPTPKKTGVKTPAGMRAEKAKVSVARKTGTTSKAPTPSLHVYRPQKPAGAVKGIRTLAVCDTITLSRQSQIDSFPILYPGCTTVKILTIEGRGASPAISRLDSLKQITEITQDLNIFRTAIPNLAGINNITKIGSYFWLDSNYAMTSTNMNNLTQLGGLVFYNSPLMTNMNGLFDNLTSTSLWSVLFGYLGVSDFTAFSRIQSVINFSVAGCPNITSLNGFHNLASADYGMSFFDNQNLSDLSVLDQITKTSYLDIYTHPNLTSLDGLQNITSIPGVLKLINNTGLTTLAQLNTNLVIENSQRPEDTLEIRFNPNLAVCSVPFLCNYLSSSSAAKIEFNSTGCTSIAEIIAACPSGCPVADSVTWNGSISNSWNDTLNWTPNRIPGTCTKVIIPSGTPNDPALYSSASIGGLVMDGSSLYLEGFNLTVSKILNITNAGIYNGTSFKANKVVNPLVQYSYFDGTFECTDYSGKAEFISNSFSGNVTLSDSVGRNQTSMAYFNVFQQNFTLINNSEYGQNYLSNASPFYDYVTGDLTVINNSSADIAIGIAGGRPLKVQGNLILNASSGRIDIDNLTYVGGTFNPSTRQLGSNPVIINNLYMESGAETRLEQPVEINNSLVFDIGSNKINTTASNLLILNSNATVTRDAGNNRGFINGPVKKKGNQAFTFPVGKYEFSLGGDKYAPITISAPANITDEFTAEHFRRNPSVDGYDTSSYSPGFGGISGREYWELIREAGTSNVSVTLSYDSSRSGVSYDLNKSQIASWNGSQWTSLSNGGSTGNIALGSVQSAQPVTNYGPITFSFKPIRKPIITMDPIDTFACIGISFKVRFSLDTAMVAGNVFRVQLSDTLGNFNASSQFIGSKSTATSDSFFVTLPGNVLKGKQYKLRLVGTLPPDTSINTVSVRVNTLPQQAFTLVGPNEVCIGNGPVKYYPSVKENGVTYTLTLGSGGGTITKVGDTSFVTFTNPSAGNTITMRTSNACGNGSPIANLTVLVKPAAPTIAPIISNIGRRITAPAAALAQNVTAIRWYKNGVLITGANSYSYYAADGGNFTAKYATDCGESPASNTINFVSAALPNIITFDAISNKVFGDAPFTINPTSTSGLPVILTLLSGPGNLTAGVYTITGAGTVTLRATQPGDNIYDTAAHVTRTFEVTKAPQTITFPTIADKEFGVVYFDLGGVSSSGLPITYTLTGPAFLSGNLLYITGLGTVSITASQPGNSNYAAALPITQTFCVKVSALTSITGAPYVCPGQTTAYQINQVPGLNYSWRIANETSLPSTSNIASITWGAAGTYTLIVSATGPCGAPTANDSFVVNVINAVTPGAVSNMLPANGATGQLLPLTLSWLPGANALTYDLYVWDSATTQPVVPLAANFSGVLYTIPAGSLAYNKTYNWKVVSKNACLQTDGPIQSFKLRPLPDLLVTDVQVPTTANSGQTITISWKVKNAGPGNTITSQSWTDAVFLSFDTIPNFAIPPNTSGAAWSQLEFPVRPLLVGTKPNVTALDSGQQYSNSINFTIPVNYSQPYYAYVITDYPASTNAPLQMTRVNDTARASNAINVQLSPTADLRVDTVFTPASTFSGSTINISYKVKNYGVLTPAGNYWVDKFFISPSPIFNSNNAIALKVPKSVNNYYPGAIDALITNTAQVAADSSYTKSLQVVVPNFIYGSYFIHVFTNANATLYEGALANNNINHNVIQVFITPTPQLTINSLAVPFTSASITQSIGINWNVFNAGFYDNIEKNKGHYYVRAGNCVSANQTLLNYIDSIGHGGSYWGDKVYLSTDGAGLNINNAILLGSYASGTQYSGLTSPEVLLPPMCVLSPSALLNNNTNNVLRPSSNHPGNLTAAIPSRLAQGNYYVYVYANQEKNVYEFPDTPSIRRSALPITILRPDLVVNNVSVPATASGAQPITIAYNIQNNGPGAVFNANRNDRMYVSTSATFNASAVLIDTRMYNASLVLNTPVPYSFTYTFPPGTSGTRYFFIQTNADSLFGENNYNNNISAAASINLSAAVPADLRITQLQFPDSVFTQSNSFIRYTIENNGTATASGKWTDSIFISCSPTYQPSTSYLVGTRPQNRTIAAGNSVVDSFNVGVLLFGFQYNNCFPQANISQAYFFIKTNAENIIYEGPNTGNNVTGSGSKTLINSFIDYIVTTVQGADTATVARKYPVNFTVKNIGYNPGVGYISGWIDALYFSTDSVFNSNAILASNFYANSAVGRNMSYSESFEAITPNIPTGDYYVLLHTIPFSNIHNGELMVMNNINLIRNASGAAKKIHVIQPLLPDLVDSIITAPSIAATGQPLTLVHRVTNKGAGVTYPNTWSNNVWISSDFIPGNAGDYLLSGKNKSAILQPGQFYDDTITAQIPLDFAQGNYVLISHTDAGNNIFEPVDTNNLAFSYVSIYRPAPADLIVQQVTIPDSVYLGYPLTTAIWTIKNNSANNATGISSDGIYLTANGVLDSTAVLLGVKNKTLNMAPLTSDTIQLQPMVNDVKEGLYRVLVKTDLLNNIVESDKTNNTGTALGSLYVKVKPLVLNVTETNTLHTVQRYYKLRIPDSLKGSTIQVSLKTNDSLTMRNEMFIGAGYVPTAAKFSYRFETPNAGNQQIVISDVSDSSYYILVRCVSPNPVVQNISLKAVKLPFAILIVKSNAGGNGGNVTVKISGSLFTNNMVAKLTKPGTTITSSSVYFVNSTTVFATFPLQGKPLGIYDVSLTKQDASVTSLAGSFSIVSPNNGGLNTGGGVNTGPNNNGSEPGCDPGADGGLNSQLVTELVHPEKVFAGWPFTVQVNYTNPTNMDVPAQVRIIYNDKNVPVAMSQNGLANAGTSLVLQLTEPGGPPGFIRAGGSGSVIIYAKAPITTPGHTIVTFNLK